MYAPLYKETLPRLEQKSLTTIYVAFSLLISQNQVSDPYLMSKLSFKLSSYFSEAIVRQLLFVLLKGGDPTAGSPTVTLLRLHPSR